jgi:hypothetical protein
MNARDTKKKKRPVDLNRLAFALVQDATEDTPLDTPPEEIPPEKDPLAVELGRRGGLRGGKARAAKLTPEERADIARIAARARWKKSR